MRKKKISWDLFTTILVNPMIASMTGFGIYNWYLALDWSHGVALTMGFIVSAMMSLLLYRK